MSKQTLTRWQQFYQDDSNLGDIAPSMCAKQAAEIFARNNSQLILDVGCGTGRDSLYLAEGEAWVVGLDAAFSGLLLAKHRISLEKGRVSWIDSDSRILPFSDAAFDGAYCFGLLHEFVGETAKTDVQFTIGEIHRVLKPSGIAILAVAAGDPEKGLPHVQNFSEAMFDAATARFSCLKKKIYDDLGCTGRTDYKVWFGVFIKS